MGGKTDVGPGEERKGIVPGKSQTDLNGLGSRGRIKPPRVQTCRFSPRGVIENSSSLSTGVRGTSGFGSGRVQVSETCSLRKRTAVVSKLFKGLGKTQRTRFRSQGVWFLGLGSSLKEQKFAGGLVRRGWEKGLVLLLGGFETGSPQ